MSIQKQVVFRGTGRDVIANLLKDGYIRPIDVHGEQYGSLVDTVAVFGSTKNPRQYWKDHKKQLLSVDPLKRGAEPNVELVANLYQLKLKSADGKFYKTDVAPLWVCVYIAMTINTELRISLAKYQAFEIKHRMSMIAHGMEWAADSIHEGMKLLEPPESLTAQEEIGYTR